MNVRDATREDLPRIAAIHVDSCRVVYSELYPPEHFDTFTVESRLQAFSELFLAPDVSLAVAGGSGIAGFCGHGRCRDEDVDTGSVYEIQSIYVDPVDWNAGVGTTLAEFVLARAQLEGYREASLWVTDSNQQAINFYRKCGFAFDGTKREHKAYERSFTDLRFRRMIVE